MHTMKLLFRTGTVVIPNKTSLPHFCSQFPKVKGTNSELPFGKG